MRLVQRYQEVSGTASVDGRTAGLSASRLVGDSIEFTLTERRAGRGATLRLTGRVSGATMTGAVQAETDSAEQAWRATRR